MELELYPWQKECLNAWKKNHYRGIVNAVTGAGKTHVALGAILNLQETSAAPLRVKIVVPGKSLLSQWKHTLETVLPSDAYKNIGVCGSGYISSTEKPYMLYVINSARYRLARQVLKELQEGCTVLLIADECHNYASGENRKIFEFLPYLPKFPGRYCALGLSATAARSGLSTILVPALGKEIFRYSLADALRKGTVCEFAIWQIAVQFQADEWTDYEELSDSLIHTHSQLLKASPGLKYFEGSAFFAAVREMAGKKHGKAAHLARVYLQLAYKRKRIVHMAKARISCVYRLLEELGLQKQILIFGESIVQIEQLYTSLNQLYPGKAGRYHSKMGAVANRNSLERFRNGELRILLTCRALDEGIDVPEAAIGIILSGTSMERQRLQRLGRILRKSDGKRIACLYYLFLTDSQEEHGYFPRRSEAFQALDLSYDDRTEAFSFPAYEAAADRMLSDLAGSGTAPTLREEMMTCLKLGYLREGWLLPPSECRQNADSSNDTREQNYWLCMEQMAKLRRR